MSKFNIQCVLYTNKVHIVFTIHNSNLYKTYIHTQSIEVIRSVTTAEIYGINKNILVFNNKIHFRLVDKI